MSIIISVIPIVVGALGATVAAIEADADKQNFRELPTNIRNENILQKTLVKMGARNIRSDNKNIGSDIDNFHIAFVRKEDQTFNIRFAEYITQKEAIKFRDELVAEYGALIQSHVYETLKRKAEEKGLELEKEVLQTDQTIVLTYRVN